MNQLCALQRRLTFYMFRFFKRGYVLAPVLICAGALPAQAEDFTGDYKVYHNDQTNENIRYQCNSMDAYVNGGGTLSGVLECNLFKLTANGHTVVAFSGKVENVDVQMINDRSILLLVHLDVANLHVESANGGSSGYFAISKNATIDMVNGSRIFIRASDKSSAVPTVRVVNLQGGEIYWCGVKIQAEHVNGGKLVEDCNWIR